METGDSRGQGRTQFTAANDLISFYVRVGSDITLPKVSVILIMKKPSISIVKRSAVDERNSLVADTNLQDWRLTIGYGRAEAPAIIQPSATARTAIGRREIPLQSRVSLRYFQISLYLLNPKTRAVTQRLVDLRRLLIL